MTAGAGVPDTRTLITKEDVASFLTAQEQYFYGDVSAVPMTEGRTIAYALQAVAPGLRARWAAEALDEAAAEIKAHEQWLRDTAQDHLDRARIVGVDAAHQIIAARAAEYRRGTR